MHNEIVSSVLPELPVNISKSLLTKAETICDVHYHDELELLYVSKGSLICIIDDKPTAARAGQIIFINSRIPHWTKTPEEGCEYILMQIGAESLFYGSAMRKTATAYLYSLLQKSSVPLQLIEDSECCRIIEEAYRQSRERGKGCVYFILSSVYYIFGVLEREGCLSGSAELPDDQAVRKLIPALEYMNEHYAKQELSLETVSGVLGLNPAYFCRLFKRGTGHSFTEYLNFLRVSKSEELLRNSSLSILDISLDVGFSSVSYYNRVFKKVKNCTPTVYRSAQYRAM